MPGYPSDLSEGALSCFSASRETRGKGQAPCTLAPSAQNHGGGIMAIGRLSMKVGKAGKAGPHAAYIARVGQYATRLERGERLAATEAGNMPAWAQSEPLAFWQAADANERKNGTTYREMEIALPRELDTAQQVALVREFVRQEVGERHAFQWAIHVPTAADGGEQPHVHLMFSERQRDGIERDPDQYFKRYNAKTPEKGGARKGYGPSAGQTLTRAERVDELKALRGRWGELCNAHLERAQVPARIDMRSHADRDTGLEPERKQLPSAWRGQGRANVIEFRAARAELVEARRALAQVVPDARAEVISLEAERQRRAEARQAEQERTRLERMSAAELAKEIERLRPAKVADLVNRDPVVMQTTQESESISNQSRQAQMREDEAKREADAWRAAHPWRSRLHDAGLLPAKPLVQSEQIQTEAKQTRERLPDYEDAELRRRQACEAARGRIRAEQVPVLAKIDFLEGVRQMRAKEEQAERQRLEALAKQEQAREAAAKEFKKLAMARQLKMHSYTDGGRKWEAVPEPLRRMVDAFNQQPEAVQAGILKRLQEDPAAREPVARMLAEHQAQQQSRDRGYGMSR